jgi:hypothetical protein
VHIGGDMAGLQTKRGYAEKELDDQMGILAV